MSSKLKTLVNPGILELTPYVPGKPITELQRELGLTDVIKLASNENPLGPSPKALSTLHDSIRGIHRYPDSNVFELKQALARQLSVKQNQIIVGNGSDEVLALIARTFVKPGQEFIVSQYAFATFSIIAHTVGAKLVTVLANNYDHDLNAMQNAINENTRMIMIANPNNPTGTWFTHKEFTAFLAAVPQHVFVIMDEAYYEYMPMRDYPDTLALLPYHPNLVITRTFSKIYGLAGLRVGYGIGHQQVLEFVQRARLPFNVNTVAQNAACAALLDHDHAQASLRLNEQGLAQLRSGINKLGLEMISKAGNFVTVDLKRESKPIFEALLKHGIIIRPLYNYHLPHHVRISVGLPEQNDRLLAILEKVLSL